MRLFQRIVLVVLVLTCLRSSVSAQGGVYGGTPFPTMPLCSSGTCGDVCTNGLCADNGIPGIATTCTPFCNHNTGFCGFTCSTNQSSCTTGWGSWGACDACWQFRVCNNNPQLGQTQYCCTPTGPGGGATNTPPSEPTVPPAPTATSVPVGTIQARAVRVDPADTSCAAIRAVPTTDLDITGTSIGFTPSSASQPIPQFQVGAVYEQFANIVTGSYTMDIIPPTADWAYARACWTNVTTGLTGQGLSRTLAANQTLRWDIGYTLGTAWVQAEGGDVYASGNVRSFVPAVLPRTFVTDSANGYPGVLSYGTLYDFDSDPFSEGATLVSSTNWQVNAGRTSVNYYDYFLRRFGSPTTPTTSAPFDNLTAVTKPASNCTAASCDSPYYVVGNMTTSGNWNIGANERVVILVDGNLTIGGRINITGNGFIAFIVNGTITVADTVGTTWSSTTPVVEGVYIATKADESGLIQTGTSINALTARFVGNGVFVADNFLLQRDLDAYGGNINASAELFTYDPQLLLTMPDTMKDLSVIWQEVAP